MKKRFRILAAIFTVLIVWNSAACSHDKPDPKGTGSDGSSQGEASDTDTLPPVGDLNVPIDRTPLNPDMSAFAAVSDSPTVQEKPSKILTDYSEIKKTYNGAICVVANNSNVWVKDGKYTSGYRFVWDGSHILGAAPTLAAFAGMKLSYNEAAKTAAIGNITAAAGQKYILVDGLRYDSESENTVIDGVLYLPLNEFVRYGMRKFYGESIKGFGVIAPTEKPYHFSTERDGLVLYGNDEYSMMMAYLVLDRYNAATLREMFDKRSREKPYPRILTVKEDAPRYKKLIETDAFMAEMSGYVLEHADYYLNQEVNIEVMGFLDGVPTFIMPEIMYYAYYMTGNRAYIEKAIANIEPILALDTWCAYSHTLSSSKCCMYLANVYDLFRDELTQKQRDDIANALIYRGIQPHLDFVSGKTQTNDWPTRDSNWNLICNAGPMYAAMVLLDEGYDDNMLLDCLEKGQVSLGYFMHHFAPDGNGWESPHYTNYILSYMVALFEGLNNYLGDDLGMMDYPGLEGVGTAAAKTTGKANGWAIHCEYGTDPCNTALNMYFTKLYGDYQGQMLNIEQNYKDRPAMEVNAYYAMKYYMPDAPEKVDYPEELDDLYSSSQIGFSRDAWGAKAKTVIGVHGGYNMDAGYQVDIGNFFYEYKGVVFADDPGIEDYALPPTAYPCRAEGANVWVVNPDASYGQSLKGYGDINMKESKLGGVIYTLDLSSAYNGYVKSALRGYMLSEDRTVFTVQDEIKPYRRENDFYWFWHTLADITVNENSRSVSLARDGVVCKIYFDSNVDFTITKQDVLTSLPKSPVVEGQNQMAHAVNMHKVVVNFQSSGEPIIFRATVVPFGKNIDRDTLAPISEWTIPDA